MKHSKTKNLTVLKLKQLLKLFFLTICLSAMNTSSYSHETRLLQQPSISSSQIAFVYGGDIWVSSIDGQNVLRLTSTQAIDKDPHFSPDGKTIAFTSNRSGTNAVYTIPAEGGAATRLTWHPGSSKVCGWSPDGKQILFASNRETAPTTFDRLWTVSTKGGPATMLLVQRGTDGSFSPDGKQIAIDIVRRWDKEWRVYRGGQNTPLVVVDLEDLSETLIPNDHTTDTQPMWLGEKVYFLSDRDWTVNIWAFEPKTGKLSQITKFKDIDVKSLAGNGNNIVFERDGYLSSLDLNTNKFKKLEISVSGDFPWAETKWEDVSKSIRAASLSPTGKRAIMESRGEIFTVPLENGDTRNITQSSDAADRAPLWSPKGAKIAWFSDEGGKGYALKITGQDGLSEVKSIPIGESAMAWEPCWSPDERYIAFTDDDVRVRVIDIENESILTADVGGTNLERGEMGLAWSVDSHWLAYSKTGPNGFRQIMAWSDSTKTATAVTNVFADAFSPSWDMDGKHLYFLASTDVALGSGWANTSAMTADPTYRAYIINLQKDDASPFQPKSDEEPVAEQKDKKDDQPKKRLQKKAVKKKKKQKKKTRVKPPLTLMALREGPCLFLPQPAHTGLFWLGLLGQHLLVNQSQMKEG